MNIKVGQLYSLRLNSNENCIQQTSKEMLIRSFSVVMEIKAVDGSVTMIPIKDRTGFFNLGEEYITNKLILESFYRLIWDPVSETASIEHNTEFGAVCSRCKTQYPHAIKASDFKCWACRNGF